MAIRKSSSFASGWPLLDKSFVTLNTDLFGLYIWLDITFSFHSISYLIWKFDCTLTKSLSFLFSVTLLVFISVIYFYRTIFHWQHCKIYLTVSCPSIFKFSENSGSVRPTWMLFTNLKRKIVSFNYIRNSHLWLNVHFALCN